VSNITTYAGCWYERNVLYVLLTAQCRETKKVGHTQNEGLGDCPQEIFNN